MQQKHSRVSRHEPTKTHWQKISDGKKMKVLSAKMRAVPLKKKRRVSKVSKASVRVKAVGRAKAVSDRKRLSRNKSMKVKGAERHGRAVPKGKKSIERAFAAGVLDVAATMQVINDAIADSEFSDYITRNIGKRTIDVIRLIANPQEDEKIATSLGIKINEVRRILNTLNTYGVARYDINKDNSGWLSFKWYVNSIKLQEFVNVVRSQKNNTYTLPKDCNDFFVCNACFSKDKIIFPFESAFDSNFKCADCGAPLRRINKEEAVEMRFGQQQQ